VVAAQHTLFAALQHTHAYSSLRQQESDPIASQICCAGRQVPEHGRQGHHAAVAAAAATEARALAAAASTCVALDIQKQ